MQHIDFSSQISYASRVIYLKEESKMDLGIKGKVALVTGAGRGLGKKTALTLAGEGANIAIFDLNMDGDWGALTSAAEIEKLGVKAKAYQTDITDAEKVKANVEQVKKDLGNPEILINAAGCVDHTAKVMNQDIGKWNRDINVNINGQFNMVRAVIPCMLEKGWGRIVNFASVAGILGGFGQLSYSTTKAAMVGFTRTIALEFAKKGITCNCIVPGLIETELVGFMPPEHKERIAKRTAFQRLGQPQDIANAITFLASDKAGYITGETLFVDGGIQLFVF